MSTRALRAALCEVIPAAGEATLGCILWIINQSQNLDFSIGPQDELRPRINDRPSHFVETLK